MKAGDVTRRKAIFWAFLISVTLPVGAAPFQLISVRDAAQSPPAGGSGDSWGPILSSDGRFVLFSSAANNLVTTTNGNALPVLIAPHLNVFLRDRTAGTTTPGEREPGRHGRRKRRFPSSSHF